MDIPVSDKSRIEREISNLAGFDVPLCQPKSRIEAQLAWLIENGGAGGSGVTKGYYYNGRFYKDAEHTEEIEPEEGSLYYDGHTTEVYIYDGTEFKLLGGLTYAAQFKDWEEDD